MSHESVTPPEREHLTTETGSPPKKKPRWGRRLLIGAGVLVVAAGVLVVFAPAIAAPFVKDAIAGTRDDGTTIAIGTLELSWTGDQRVSGLVVTDPAGDVIADLDASLDRSLLDLLGDRNDLGTLTLAGSARLKNPPPDAETPGEEPAPDTGEASIDLRRDLSDLAVALNVTALDLTIDRPAGGPILAAVTGTASLTPQRGLSAEFHADVSQDGRTAPVDLSVSSAGVDLADASGRALTARLRTEGAPVALFDALANQGGRLTALLGETADADATVTLSGPDALTADAALRATGATMSAKLRIENGVLTADGPVTATLDTAGALALPGVARSLADAGMTVGEAPTVTLEVSELRFPVETDPKTGLPRPPEPASLDLRRASALVSIAVSEARADVPGSYFGSDDPATGVRTAPGTFVLDATDPAGTVTLRGSLRADVAGSPAGSVGVDLRASDLLDASGALRPTLPRLAGTLTASDVPTALAQPFVAKTPLDLPRDIGPTLRLSLVADAPARDEPARLTLTAQADKLTASGTGILSGGVLTTEGPVRLELLDPAPAVARALGQAPVTLDRTGPLDVTITDVRIDTARALADDPDLAGATATAVVRVGPIEGAVGREGEGAVPLRLPRVAYTARLADDAVALETSYPSIRVGEGETIGTTDVALRLAEPLGARALTGTVTLSRVDGPAIASAFAGARAGEIARDMGPMFSVTLRPDLAPGATTAGELDLVGAKIDLTARAALARTGLDAVARVHRVSTDGLDALTGRPGLAAAAMGPTASGFVSVTAGATPEGAVAAPYEATVELTSAKLRTAAPARVRVTKAAAELMGEARLDMTVEPELFAILAGSGPDATRLASPTPLRISVAEAFVPLAPAADAPLSARAQLSTDAFTLAAPDGTEQRFTALRANVRTTDTPNQLALDATLAAPGAAADTLSARLTVDDLVAQGGAEADPALSGTVRADKLPTALIDAFAGTGGTAARMLGPTADVRVDLAGLPREGSTVAASMTAPYATLSYKGEVEGGSLIATEPASLALSTVQQEFGFEVAKFIPVIGGLTKTPSDQPATVTIPTLSIPIGGDLKDLTFALTADPGTAAIQLEKGIAGLIDPRLVQQGRRLGESFEPFNVAMKGRVLTITDFTLPIGEFNLPATATYDFNANTEDVVVRLPAGMLLAESLGGDLGPLRGILGSALNPPLRKRGPIGADNSWKIDPSWKPPAEERQNQTEQIIEGLGGLLRDQLERNRKKDEKKDGAGQGEGGQTAPPGGGG